MLDTMKVVTFLPTTDYDAARAFFEGILGLRFISHDGFASVFDCNGIMLRISKVPDFTPFPFTVLGWEVPDIAAAVTELTTRGVTFERFGFFEQDSLGIWTAPSGDKVAWFKDPSGNTLSVSQHVA